MTSPHFRPPLRNSHGESAHFRAYSVTKLDIAPYPPEGAVCGLAMLSQLSDDALFDKRRIARACDACNQLRVKCDGQSQCQHCTECGYTCSYARPVKKRGKIPGRPPMRRKINSSPSSSQAPTFPSEFNTPRGGEFGLQPSPTKVHSEDSMTNSMVQEPPVVLPTNDPSTRPFDHISPLSPLRMNHSPEMGWPGQHEVNGRHRSSSVSEDTTTLPRLAPEWRHWLSDMGSQQMNLRYPVLSPVMSVLHFLSPVLACDMLETYFSHSPWVKAYLVRKSSILAMDPSKVRPTKPALIFAMLCVAAHTHDDPLLSSTPSSRPRVLQRLFELTTTALRPLQGNEAEPSLDDIITYIQIGTILSGSEYKAMSIRWWQMAYSLSKEINLNMEVAEDISEEMREERRRTFWLMYCADRHQALATNRSVVFRDTECAGLLHPCEERTWRSSEPLNPLIHRERGLSYYVSDGGLFGFFLPLMSILGEIISLHSLSYNQDIINLEPLKITIQQHLGIYDISLEEYHVGPDHPDHFSPFRYYARQIMHTLHILVAGKWDPMEMLNDADGWISSEEFVSCTAHAVEAANAVQGMLSVDPELMFMPMFFGLYLLQGSLLLLLIIDKLGSRSDPSVLRACEVIIRAHEVCVVTLSTEYQKKFRKIMRALVSGIAYRGDPYATEEEKMKNVQEAKIKTRGILGLYRWNATGQGLITTL